MSWTDLILAGAIALGALYLLYRSIWKKQGHCCGCDSGSCCPNQAKNTGDREEAVDSKGYHRN